MLTFYLALGAVGSALSASVPAPLKGCPNGGAGIGISQVCPGGGFDCPTYGQTATVYAPGSCKPVAHSTSIGAANFCFDTYTNDVIVGCDGVPDNNTIKNITIPDVGTFSNCVYSFYLNPIDCTVGDASSDIAICCDV